MSGSDDAAIAQHQVYRAIVRLCDGITSDPTLLLRVVAILGKEGR
jgi:hypothetical protein